MPKTGATSVSGAAWWRSLDELVDAPEFREYLQREFPENASQWFGESRRDFLRLMGASLFLAGVSGCDIKTPQEKIVPAVRAVDHAPPGLPLYFATAMDFAGSAVGLTVQSRDGRPIKIEGNANHPSSLGSTDVFAQAATLDLYDPDRARAPIHRGTLSSLEQLRQTITSLRQRLDDTNGRGFRLLIGNSSSPTIGRLLDNISTRWPQSRWFVYESVNDDHRRAGMSLAFGDSAIDYASIFDFANTSVVVSVDDDFLSARDHPPCYVRQFADARRIVRHEQHPDTSVVNRHSADAIVRLYHIGPTPTPTSAKADFTLAAAQSEIEGVMIEVARRLRVLDADDEASTPTTARESRRERWIEQLVDDLRAAGERALVVAGRHQAPTVHALAHAINQMIGAVGNTVRFIKSPQLRPARSASDVMMLEALSAEMEAGDVKALFVLGTNPVFDAPADIEFGAAMANVELTLTSANDVNETSQTSKWLVPRSHFLECWGDARAHDGTATIMQPLISPLYRSLSDIELLTLLCDDAPSGYLAVRKTWHDSLELANTDADWQQSLADGVIKDTASPSVSLLLSNPDQLIQEAERSNAGNQVAPTDSANLEIVFRPDPTIWDGRFLNNGWLQELPKPLSHIVWDNTAWIAPRDAQRLGLKDGAFAAIGSPTLAVEIPIHVAPGHAEGCMTVFNGYGRKIAGRVATGTGFDVQRLITAQATTHRNDVPVRVTDQTHQIVTTQHHQTMEGRHIARAGSLEAYLETPDHPPFAHPLPPTPADSFYEDWSYENDNKWGMTIDLTACVGCSACVIACQAENNIPIVGKEQCGMNRHMHWIRVDTYHQGPPEQPDHTLHQPVPCMQCERAPCEVVCPVAATNHSDDGLNQMIYNRCVGTRYCSNNCPYKVRRFNFLDFSDNFIADPSLHLLSNPEVTMRSRGVMEKCTYCVQRIAHARIGAQLEDRQIRDGEILTACQSVCPARAIEFGDLNDEHSRVRATREHPLNYALLEELNTKPRTTYLAEVHRHAADGLRTNSRSEKPVDSNNETSG